MNFDNTKSKKERGIEIEKPIMEGIKSYTHEQRLKVLEEIVPLLNEKFGDNLVAIAARGSTARNTDGPYSDVELFAFLKEMLASDPLYGKLRKINDGLLVEILWLTKETYIKEVREINPAWFGSGADILMPLTNKGFVQAINDFSPENKKEKCFNQATAMWGDFKKKGEDVLGIIEEKSHSQVALAFHRFYDSLLNLLSFINQTPYTTYSQKIQECEKFSIKPRGFSKLTEILLNGDFHNSEIRTIINGIIQELKEYLDKSGHTPEEKEFSKDEQRPDSFGVKDIETKIEQAVAVWDKVQEATTKVLNAVSAGNVKGMAVVINDMFFQYLKVLSCVNGTPLRFSHIIDDAKKLNYQPRGFSDLITIIEEGEYKNLSKIEESVTNLFTELENYLEKLGAVLYQDNFDPSKPIQS